MVRRFNKFGRYLFGKLPDATQQVLVRQRISIPQEINPDLTLKVADSYEELEQAFHLLYMTYLETGFEQENARQLRVLSQHLLPSTTTLVAKYRATVVATLTIVKDGILGLPMDRIFNTQGFKRSNSRIAEISSLAIKREHRRSLGGQALFPLLKYMYSYCIDYLDVETIIVAIHPKDAPFYKGLLLFEDVDHPTVDYLGAPAKALYLNMIRAKDDFKRKYAHRRAEQNLYQYFSEQMFANMIFPERNCLVTNDSILTSELLVDFFFKRAQIFDLLPAKEYVEIKKFYSNTHLLPYFESLEANQLAPEGNCSRFQVSMKGLLSPAGGHPSFTSIEVDEVSDSECRIRLVEGLSISKELTYHLKIDVSDTATFTVLAKLIWIHNERLGFRIMRHDGIWNQLIALVEQEHRGG